MRAGLHAPDEGVVHEPQIPLMVDAGNLVFAMLHLLDVVSAVLSAISLHLLVLLVGKHHFFSMVIHMTLPV